MVESQFRTVTRALVDSDREQRVLEALLDEAKPPIPTGHEWTSLHYLLATPFRYPPLRHGSRFRQAFEPGVWYGSEDRHTAFAETAYWRLRFLNDSQTTEPMETPLTAFNVELRSTHAIDLTHAPFDEFHSHISHPQTYEYSQPLGSAMREAAVALFRYRSARARAGKNIGVFSPTVFQEPAMLETTFEPWHLYGTPQTIELTKDMSKAPSIVFERHQFEVKGNLPIV